MRVRVRVRVRVCACVRGCARARMCTCVCACSYVNTDNHVAMMLLFLLFQILLCLLAVTCISGIEVDVALDGCERKCNGRYKMCLIKCQSKDLSWSTLNHEKVCMRRYHLCVFSCARVGKTKLH